MKSEKKQVYEWFYETKRIPDMGLYVKRVLSSCKTVEQLDTTLKWGRKVLAEHAYRNNDDYSLWQVNYIHNRLKRVVNDIVTEYGRCKENLR